MTIDVREVDQYLKQALKDSKVVAEQIEAQARRDFLILRPEKN